MVRILSSQGAINYVPDWTYFEPLSEAIEDFKRIKSCIETVRILKGSPSTGRRDEPNVEPFRRPRYDKPM
jgi:hypothetical protein